MYKVGDIYKIVTGPKRLYYGEWKDTATPDAGKLVMINAIKETKDYCKYSVLYVFPNETGKKLQWFNDYELEFVGTLGDEDQVTLRKLWLDRDSITTTMQYCKDNIDSSLPYDSISFLCDKIGLKVCDDPDNWGREQTEALLLWEKSLRPILSAAFKQDMHTMVSTALESFTDENLGQYLFAFVGFYGEVRDLIKEGDLV